MLAHCQILHTTNCYCYINNLFLVCTCSSKGLKIMNLGDAQPTVGIKKVLENDDDDAVDPHLERIKNEAGGDESDEEVIKLMFYIIFTLIFSS